jgi:uncharacterized membrane protein
MSDISKARKRSLIGSLLLLIPGINIVGLILMVTGLKDLAEHYKDTRIYREIITDAGTLFGIFGLISLSISIFILFWPIFSPTPSDIIEINFARSWAGAIMLFTWIAASICFSVMALFFRKSFYALTACSGVRLFRTAGNLLLISAIVPILGMSLIIVIENMNARTHYSSHAINTLIQYLGMPIMLSVFVGPILVYVAFILLAVAFFSLKPVPSKCTNS